MKIRTTSMSLAVALAFASAAFAGTENGNATPAADPAAAEVSQQGSTAAAPAVTEGAFASEFAGPHGDGSPAHATTAIAASSVARDLVQGAVLGLRAASVLGSTRYDVRYRPRRGNSWARRAPDAASVSQLHLGWYDQDGDVKPQFLLGVRGGPLLSPNFQLGAGVDWAHKSSTSSSITRRTTGPGGVPIEVREDLGEVSTHFVPVYAFAQVQADDDMGIVPYFGGALGYELMFLHARDFQSNTDYDATFGGWGWQAWGGAGVPLSGRTRLTGEVYVNGGELHRDVDDVLNGGSIRETVDANGFGARFGVAWGF